MYYSFALSEDENIPNIENSTWKNKKYTPGQQVPKANATLLRKVLHPNFTPRSENFRKVSSIKQPKATPKQQTSERDIPRILNIELQSGSLLFENKRMEEHSRVKSIIHNLESKSVADCDSPKDDTEFDTTDDLECEMQNTVIEKSTDRIEAKKYIEEVFSREIEGSNSMKTSNTDSIENIPCRTKKYKDVKSQSKSESKIGPQRSVHETQMNITTAAQKSSRFTTYNFSVDKTKKPIKGII